MWHGRSDKAFVAKRTSKVTVSEPFVHELDRLMQRYGVSDERLAGHFGWGKDRLLRWRRMDQLWRRLGELRAAFDALGYEIRLVRKKAVLTSLTRSASDVRAMKNRALPKWNKAQMWEVLDDEVGNGAAGDGDGVAGGGNSNDDANI